MDNVISPEYAMSYMLGGNSWVVFYNTQSKNQHRYQIRRSDFKKNDKNRVPTYYVYDVDSIMSEYIGHINIIQEKKFVPRKNYLEEMSEDIIKSITVFSYMFRHILEGKVPQQVLIMHNGHCSACGKPLKDAESLRLGIGPKCRGDK